MLFASLPVLTPTQTQNRILRVVFFCLLFTLTRPRTACAACDLPVTSALTARGPAAEMGDKRVYARTGCAVSRTHGIGHHHHAKIRWQRVKSARVRVAGEGILSHSGPLKRHSFIFMEHPAFAANVTHRPITCPSLKAY